MFANKNCGMTISSVLNTNSGDLNKTFGLKSSLFLSCKTLISLLEDPMKFHTILLAEDVLLTSQGLLLESKIRIPEKSDLLISILPFALMSKDSPFFYHLNQVLVENKNDRYNKELFHAYEREVTFHISHSLLFHSLTKYMANFEKYEAGRCYDFNSYSIADIDAEYIRIPKTESFEWFKKSTMNFMFKSILSDNMSSILRYNSEGRNQDFLIEMLISEDVSHDYKVSVIINAFHTSICKESKKIDDVKQSNLLEMINNAKNARSIVTKIGMPKNYAKNEHLMTKRVKAALNKKSLGLSSMIIDITENRIKLFEGIQLSKMQLGDFEYNEMMKDALQLINQCIKSMDVNDEEFYTKALNSISKLAKLGKLEYFDTSRFAQYKKNVYVIMKNLDHKIEGIEKFQHGLWVDGARSFYNYLTLYRHEYFNFTDWSRNFERAWYITIANTWGFDAGVYLPVNALNYIDEDAKIPESEDFDPYYQILYYEKDVDLQEVDKAKSLEFLINMLVLYKNVFQYLKHDHPYNMEK
jgi:hypothetical protein